MNKIGGKNNVNKVNKKEETDKLLSFVIESIDDAIYLKDKKLKYFNLNSKAEVFFNKQKSDILNKKDTNIFSDIETRRLQKIDKRVLEGEIIREEVVVSINETKKIYLNTKSPLLGDDGQIVGICGIAHDITRSREKEIELDLKNKMNKDILENSPVGMFVISSNGMPTFVNKKMIEISGANYERFMEINFFKHQPYKELGILSKIKKAFKGQKFVVKNVRYISRFGKKETVRNFIGVPIDGSGNVSVLMIVEDITELKKEEEELKKASYEWSNTFDSMTSGISIHSRDNIILNANKYLCKMLNVKKEEIIGKKCFKIFHNLSSTVGGCPMQKTLKSKKRETLEYYEAKLKKWVMISTSPVFNEKGEVEKIIHIVDDITEKKKQEKEKEKRNRELEIFNKIAVNREMKMIELKKEIKKLKKEIKK